MKDVFILGGARTAIGKFQGTLSAFTPTEFGITAAKATVERTKVDPSTIDASVFASVIPTEGRDLYHSRTIGIGVGMPKEGHSMNVNRLCGSGIQAIISGAQMIITDDANVVLVGGAESMSRAPFSVEGMRQGRPMGNGQLYDWLNGGMDDPFSGQKMGTTAENIAEKYGISRERQDEFALESQERAATAIETGVFKGQIVTFEGQSGRKTISFDTDEHPRMTSLEKLSKLPAVFKKNGTVTPGNASGMNDAAAALVLASEDAVNSQGLNPMGRLVSWAITGVDPSFMGLGPVTAVPKALKRAGLTLDDIDVIESNEAFAAQAIAVNDQLGLDPAKTNPNGGAIALGHPVAATGGILTVKALHHLKDTGSRYGLITMCIGGGQGIAIIVEAI